MRIGECDAIRRKVSDSAPKGGGRWARLGRFLETKDGIDKTKAQALRGMTSSYICWKVMGCRGMVEKLGAFWCVSGFGNVQARPRVSAATGSWTGRPGRANPSKSHLDRPPNAQSQIFLFLPFFVAFRSGLRVALVRSMYMRWRLQSSQSYAALLSTFVVLPLFNPLSSLLT